MINEVNLDLNHLELYLECPKNLENLSDNQLKSLINKLITNNPDTIILGVYPEREIMIKIILRIFDAFNYINAKTNDDLKIISFIILRNEYRLPITRIKGIPLKKMIKITKLLGKNLICRTLIYNKSCINYDKYINDKGTLLKVSENVKLKVKQIIDELKDKPQHHSPMQYIAGAFYISCLLNNERISQNEIAQAFNIQAVGLRNAYKELLEKCNLGEVNDY